MFFMAGTANQFAKCTAELKARFEQLEAKIDACTVSAAASAGLSRGSQVVRLPIPLVD